MTFIVTILAFIVVLGLLVAIHEYGHYKMAILMGVRVVRFAVGFGQPLFKWTPAKQPLLDGKPQTTEFVVAMFPLGGYVKMQDEREPLAQGEQPIDPAKLHQSFNRKSLAARSAIVVAGPVANFIFAIAIFSVVNWWGVERPQARIVSVMPGEAAAMAKLAAGDLVIKVDQTPITDSLQIRELIRRSNKSVTQEWQIQRDNDVLLLRLTPQPFLEQNLAQGPQTVGRIGASIGSKTDTVMIRYGLFDGAAAAVEKTGELTWLTLTTLGKMIIGQASLRNLSGPVTVAEYSGKTAMLGATTFLLFLGLVSVSLGVLNLLPLPMLDGGHLMYFFWELLTGRPVSDHSLFVLQRLGFVVLSLLALLALYNDLIRIFGFASWLN